MLPTYLFSPFAGLQYVLNSTKIIYNQHQIVTILNALNNTSFFDQNTLEKSLDVFIKNNFENVLLSLADIIWMSVPFYKILKKTSKLLTDELVKLDRKWIPLIEKQTEVIPKRIKCRNIRKGIQEIYARITALFAKVFGTQELIKTITNIFQIEKHPIVVSDCLKHSDRVDLRQLCNDHKFPDDLTLLIAISLYKSDNTLPINTDKAILSQDVDNLDENLSWIYNILDILLANIDEENTARMLINVDILEFALSSKETLNSKVRDILIEIWTQVSYRLDEFSWKILKLMLKFNICDINADKVFEVEVQCLTESVMKCQFLVTQREVIGKHLTKLKTNLEDFSSNDLTFEKLATVIDILESLNKKNLKLDCQFMFSMTEKILYNWRTSLDDIGRLMISKKFLSFLFNSTNSNNESIWIDKIVSVVESMLESSNVMLKLKLLETLQIFFSKYNCYVFRENPMREMFRKILVAKILHVEMLTTEQR